jgi:uncharacterized membrane protein YhaH (DUF805 family)
MNFFDAIKSGYSNYVNFSGRAIRSEYWYWVLFTIIASAVTAFIDTSFFALDSGVMPLNNIFGLITFVPSLAISLRRLHDIDRTGWWILIGFTVIGLVLLIYWACQKGTPGPNRYGPDPFGAVGQISPRPAA